MLRTSKKILEGKHKYRLAHLEEYATRERKYSRQLLQDAIKILGNRCVRCGFDNWKALQIDHVNGGGTKERKKGVGAVYRRVIKHPEDYQLLCANCNWIKRVDNGECNQHGT